ncbi:hypothetical protein, partial [Nostoc sp. 'Peltigera membranacea cyanobiont' 213]|uniref:hypothetical protein n=1 Tax=Nostoc sp. 'Peltigera membranacea cyanobiont' 213 TaxID=2014530 RepID=UPI001CB8E8A1
TQTMPIGSGMNRCACSLDLAVTVSFTLLINELPVASLPAFRPSLKRKTQNYEFTNSSNHHYY